MGYLIVATFIVLGIILYVLARENEYECNVHNEKVLKSFIPRYKKFKNLPFTARLTQPEAKEPKMTDREAFEKSLMAEGFSALSLNQFQGEYTLISINSRWLGWQAAWKYKDDERVKAIPVPEIIKMAAIIEDIKSGKIQFS